MLLVGCSKGEDATVGDPAMRLVPKSQPDLKASVVPLGDGPERTKGLRHVHGRTVVDITTVGAPRFSSWDLVTGRLLAEKGPGDLAPQGSARIRGSSGRARPLVLLQLRRDGEVSVVAVDARTGRRVWTRDLGERGEAGAHVVGDDDAVFLALDDGTERKLHALNPRDGTTLWSGDDLTPVMLRDGHLGVARREQQTSTSVRRSDVALLDARTGDSVSLNPPASITDVRVDSWPFDLVPARRGERLRSVFDLRNKGWVECPVDADAVGRDHTGRVLFAAIRSSDLVTWAEKDDTPSVVTIPEADGSAPTRVTAVTGGGIWCESDDTTPGRVLDRAGRKVATLPEGVHRWWGDDLLSIGEERPGARGGHFHRVRVDTVTGG